jgi:dolichyl-phosphate-mannose--protein O-mannosyl transferase
VQKDTLISHAYEWPLLRRGLRLNAWGEGDVRMYLVGSPAAWWGGAGALVVWLAAVLVEDRLHQRGFPTLAPGTAACSASYRTACA